MRIRWWDAALLAPAAQHGAPVVVRPSDPIQLRTGRSASEGLLAKEVLPADGEIQGALALTQHILAQDQPLTSTDAVSIAMSGLEEVTGAGRQALVLGGRP